MVSSARLPLLGVSGLHILLHDFLVIDRVPDINVRFVWHVRHGGIQIENVWRGILAVEVRIETLHQSCFALWKIGSALSGYL